MKTDTQNQSNLDLCIEAVYGKQNSDMIEGAGSIYSALLELLRLGFTVLDFSMRNNKPVITIQSESRCNTLDNATSITRPAECGGQESVQVARIRGCQVEWVRLH